MPFVPYHTPFVPILPSQTSQTLCDGFAWSGGVGDN